MNESEDWELAVYCYSLGRDVDIEIQPVDIGHLHRVTIVVQGMLQEFELEICTIWKGEDLWSVEIVSGCIQMSFMLVLPMRCGVNGIILRIVFHLWWRKSVG